MNFTTLEEKRECLLPNKERQCWKDKPIFEFEQNIEYFVGSNVMLVNFV